MTKKTINDQFSLPERKAKVNQLVKTIENVDDPDTRYCICRSTDGTRFMIACDNCEEWYHGDCIGITETDANDIKQYYCGRCRAKDPSLKTRYKHKKKSHQHKGDHSHRYRQEVDEVEELQDDMPHQCLGPSCMNHTRQGSNRIYELLPPKIQQWQSSPCVAEERNRRTLDKIRREQMEARQRLMELDMKHKELDALVENAKNVKAESDNEQASETEDDTEYNLFCVTCGHEISQKTALKHLEKCFAKFEAQTSFGSIYKTRIEGSSMFCDFYNSQSRTYCKRLKVLCPEHTKEPRVSAEEVCGCPLVTDVFEESEEICRTAKRRCNKHHCWEKCRRAQVDMERVRQWMKIDELFEQERNVRFALSNRMGVLGLMLHQTVDHNPLYPISVPDID
ncbi:CXXC1-like protein [Mya arenaria]|uniref:CXXC-type zinc finger protein 1 n=1 Tax=Mya arenaria TaxID=6604 RepID=A0ABY7G194_MYAAR|nr:CXXC1-like protein [Mya arenaria]